MPFATLAAFALVTPTLLVCSPAGHPIVTEVVYDAPGDDTGWEFVEFWNASDRDVALAGVVIEAGDGAGPGRWTKRWTGGVADTIRAHARFVVGGAHVTPPPDALVTLELQNGPDGLRITWPDGAREVVGWGALAYPEYACGAPAPDVAAGQSLARVPDDADRGGNALDFRASEPSPGRPNQPGVDLSLQRGSLACSPAAPDPGASAHVAFAVTNRGAQPLAAGTARVALAGDVLADSAWVPLPAIAPGETLAVAAEVRTGLAGARVLVARAFAPGDEAPGNDADTLRVRVGPGPIEITEIQFHPAAGEGEWVELRNRSASPVELAGWTFSDRADARSPLDDAPVVEPESLLVLAQDPAALAAAFPALDPARLVRVASWPSLNNSDAADGVADILTLRESDDLPSDRVAYSAAGVPAGATLEKSSGAWRASAAPNGTPLAPPRGGGAHALAFAVHPRAVPAGAPEVAVDWTLPWPAARVTIELVDLAGHRVARLLDAETSAASGSRRLRLDGAGPGVFVAVLRARSTHGVASRGVPLRVVGSAP